MEKAERFRAETLCLGGELIQISFFLRTMMAAHAASRRVIPPMAELQPPLSASVSESAEGSAGPSASGAVVSSEVDYSVAGPSVSGAAVSLSVGGSSRVARVMGWV